MTSSRHGEEGIALPCDALLFDLDGTLAASAELIEHTWRQWFELLNIVPPSWHELHGRTARDIALSTVPGYRVEDALVLLTLIELAQSEFATPVPGALELLQSIPANRFAIVTGARRDVAMTRIRAAGLRDDCLIITADETARGKPHPDGFLSAAEQLGFEAARCVAFEDSSAGVRSALAAGCATIRIGDAHETLGADFALADLTSVSYSARAVHLAEPACREADHTTIR